MDQGAETLEAHSRGYLVNPGEIREGFLEKVVELLKQERAQLGSREAEGRRAQRALLEGRLCPRGAGGSQGDMVGQLCDSSLFKGTLQEF